MADQQETPIVKETQDVEKTPTWEHPRWVGPNYGPQREGGGQGKYVLPGGTDAPTRPVNRQAADGVNSRTIDRPAQGIWKGQDLTIPTPKPWGRP